MKVDLKSEEDCLKHSAFLNFSADIIVSEIVMWIITFGTHCLI